MKQQELIDQLIHHTGAMLTQAKGHTTLSEHLLRHRPSPSSWNALECYEHMNRFGKLYLRYFAESMDKASKGNPGSDYHPGLIGGWSARSMEPKNDGGIRMPMKTFKTMDPMNDDVSNLVIDRFIKQQEELLPLLEIAKQVNIDAVKCRTSLNYLRFRLGDALRFYVNHNRRHFIQIGNILNSNDQDAVG